MSAGRCTPSARRQAHTSRDNGLFNDKRCVVVEAGLVERLLQHLEPLAEYAREGDLYLVAMMLSPFARQGPEA